MTTATPPAPSLSERVASALAENPYSPGIELRVEEAEGSVHLHGRVTTFFEKQMAQEIVLRLDGVERVENLLEVSWA